MLLQELFVRIGAQANEAQFAAAKRSIDGLKVGIAALSAVGGLVAYRLGSITKEMTSLAKDIQVTSQMVGVGVEALQELQYVAKQTGSDAGSLTIGLRFLASNMQAVAEGSKKDVATFASLGVSVKDASGNMRPLDEVMLDIADRFKAMPDGAKKAALAIELFGRGGLTMVPMLNQGREGIQALRNELRQVGGVMSADTVEAGARLEDTIDKMNAAITGLRISLFSLFAPKLTELIDKKIVPAIAKFRAWEERTHGLEKALKAIAYVLAGLATTIAMFSFGKAIMAIGEVVTMMRALGNAAFVAQAKMLAIPILVGAAFAAFLLVIQDVYYYLNGHDSLLGEIAKKNPAIKAIGDTFRWIGGQIAVVVKFLEYLASGFDSEKWWELKDFMAFAGWGVVPRGKREEIGAHWENIVENAKKAGAAGAGSAAVPWSSEKIAEMVTKMKDEEFLKKLGGSIDMTNPLHRAMLYEHARKTATPQTAPVISAPITINAVPGMSEEELANKVKEKVVEAFSDIDAKLLPAQ